MYPIFQDVKYYLGVERNEDDYLIATLLEQSVKLFESLTGRTFVSSVENKTFYAGDRIFLSKNKMLLLDDLCSLSTLTIAGENVPLDKIILPSEIPYGTIILKNSSPFYFYNYSATDDPSEIIINGSWSYSTTCPADVFSAIIRLTAWKYHQKDTGADYDRPVIFQDKVATPIGIPNDVMDIIKIYRKAF